MCLKAFALIDRVVQLRISIGNFLTTYHKFKAFGEVLIRTVFLGKRRHLFRIVGDKGRLDKVAFALFAKYLINELALAHSIIYFYANGLGKSSEFVLALSCNVKACKALDGFGHRNTWIRRFEIHFVLAKGGFGGTIYRLSTVLQEVFGEFHHPVVVLVSYIYFHSCKFRIVGSVHSLVAEVLSKFVHPIKASYDEALEVEFVGNTHIEWNIQSIVMSNKRTRRSTPWDCLKDRSFYFYISMIVEVLTHRIE